MYSIYITLLKYIFHFKQHNPSKPVCVTATDDIDICQYRQISSNVVQEPENDVLIYLCIILLCKTGTHQQTALV